MIASRRLQLTQDPAADELLAREPLALLIGMLLDQQVPMERAFAAPRTLVERLGHAPTAAEIAAFDPQGWEEIFSRPPALHRFPASMARRVQALCRLLVEDYDGDAEAVWRDAADGQELVRRLGRLPGFGPQKARIFAALLGKQCGVRPPGWQEATAPYGEEGVHRSVADVDGPESLASVRAYKQEQKRARAAKGSAEE